MISLGIIAVRGLLRPLALLVATLVATAGFSHANDSGLPGVFDPYIHRASSGAAADPINLIFRGASADTVLHSAEQTLDWTPVAGSPMDFLDASHTRASGWQLGYDLGQGSRYHMRIEAVSTLDGQSYVLAAVHRDDTVACGHVGRAFDRAREVVAQAYVAAGYTVSTVWLGNTTPGPQCDGSRTAGDGSAVIINLAH